MAKPKVAFYWCASCGGCEETVVDLAEGLLGLVEKVEIVLWPVALDFKYREVEALADQSLVATFLNGAIRSTEQAAMARLLRRKSQYLIAYGSCAHLGGVPGLANLYSREELLRFNYEGSPSVVNEGRVRPRVEHQEGGHVLHLPELHRGVRALDQVVEVDYYVPGCPPTPQVTQAAVGALLEGRLPGRGAVLAPDVALCSECPRRESKPVEWELGELVRPHQRVLDPGKCFLAQGVVCMGPATRAGCGSQCPGGNMPCTGCFGPTSRVRDQGAKMLAGLCSNVGPKEEAGIDAVLAGMPDPVGTLYRYGLAKSLLRRRVNVSEE